MKSIFISSLGYLLAHLNCYWVLSQDSNPLSLLGIYLGLGLMLYPIVNSFKIKKRRGYVR